MDPGEYRLCLGLAQKSLEWPEWALSYVLMAGGPFVIWARVPFLSSDRRPPPKGRDTFFFRLEDDLQRQMEEKWRPF
jgi:hypothetical protein